VKLVCGIMLCIKAESAATSSAPRAGGATLRFIIWPGPTAWCLMQPCAEHLCSHHCTVFDATLR
jgi:hypothetical protein